MKKLMIFFVLLGLVVSSLYAQKTIVLANGEWKPYLSKDLKNFGYASQVVTEAFKSVGYDVKYEWYGDSWKRAYQDAVDNKVDGTLVWSYSDDRAKEMYYSQSAIVSGKTDVIYHLKDKDIQWEKIEDLYQYKFGGVLGYTYGAIFDQAEKDGKINIERIKSDELNFKKLLAGRIDCFISGKKVGMDLLEEKFTPEERAKITYSQKPMRVVTYHLLLNKKNSENAKIIEAFDKGFKILEEDGRLKKYQEELDAGLYEK